MTITPEQWQRLKDAFSLVIARGPNEVCEALEQVCRGDEQLRAALEPLVSEHFRQLKSPVTLDTSGVVSPELPELLAERFRVIARLGSGTFGDVYRVVDCRVGADLAVKVLRSSDAVALEYFKREFRSLVGVHHPNILALYELIVVRNQWMFSMELVNGVDFLQFITHQIHPLRVSALRAALIQLATGVQELHLRGLLHRDLKPSNVMVTVDGRVVLLDFGLVKALGGNAIGVTFGGTPDYMSPEQAGGAAVSEPADWYSVGVMLYQALTGQLPFRGDFLDVLRRKTLHDPPSPDSLVPNVDPQLSALSMKLLERDPESRAGYDDIAAVCRATSIPRRTATNPLFVGRAGSLRRLVDAFADAETQPVLAHVFGPSGIGKTVLIREFLQRLDGNHTAVFAGRCYEGQSVPYQALDDVVDHIAQFLRRLPLEQIEVLLPRNFGALVRMFPVLGQFATTITVPVAAIDSAELRIRALAALREMFGRIAERRRVVVVIDDLQWGDEDGCVSLHELLHSADCPPMLVLVAYRSEDVATSKCLSSLNANTTRTPIHRTARIELDKLERSDSEDLAAFLLARPVSPDLVRRVADHSEGNPFLIHEIVRWIESEGTDRGLSYGFTLTEIVQSRVNALRAESRHLLELVGVAGQPTALAVLRDAAGVDGILVARDDLIAGRLVRSRIVHGREELEVYHDRVRQAINANLDLSTRAACHLKLAEALEAADGDPERIATHFHHAGEADRCGRYALEAGHRAVDVLAFNKAAQLFRLALANTSLSVDTRRIIRGHLGDALAYAGHGADAARHYLDAARTGSIQDQLKLKQRAAEELLYSGHVDRGLAIFEQVLQQVGIRMPRATSRLPVSLLVRRARLAMRGLRWRERDAASLPPNMLLRLDTCSAVATGLALIDIARGAVLQATSLLLALEAGEPRRVACALAMEAGYRSTGGVKSEKRAASILAEAQQLAQRTGDPKAIGLSAVMAAACAWSSGRWEECYERASSAKQALHGRYERVSWERDTASIFEVDGLRWMGRWSKMKGILPELLEDARSRGDLYAQAILQMHGGSCAELANDSPDDARAGLAILEHWSNRGFHVEHLVETHNQVEIDLYLGLGPEGLALLDTRWPELQRSLLLRVQNFAVQMHSLRARAALSAACNAASSTERRGLLRRVSGDVRAIARQKTGWGDALCDLLRSGIERAIGRDESSVAALVRAEAGFSAAGMCLHAAVARRLRGSLLGGDAGPRLVSAANHEMLLEGIVNPARFTAMMAPGFRGF